MTATKLKPAVKETPLLMKAEMVRATLANQKTQTRRIAWEFDIHRKIRRSQPDAPVSWAGAVHPARESGWVSWFPGDLKGLAEFTARQYPKGFECRYGGPGDQLWIKETFYAWGRWVTRFNAEKHRDEWHFIDLTLESGKQYQYAEPQGYQKSQRGGVLPAWWKRPAIFMPRRASRLTLEIVSVRVERLNAITEADAIAEGVVNTDPPHPLDGQVAQFNFMHLWERINGKRASWESNPWCWVIEFRRILDDLAAREEMAKLYFAEEAS